MAENSEKQAESDREKGDYSAPDDNVDTIGVITEIVNASGHRDQLNRQYGILSICGMALTVDNAWVAVGTSLNVAICKFCNILRSHLGADCSFPDNGGPPGVLYELLVACFYYCFIAASIAEVCLLIEFLETVEILITFPAVSFGGTFLGGCLPLGISEPRPEIWSRTRILHRLFELLRLAI
jgi:hypothetical protein